MVGGACAQNSIWSSVFGRNDSLTPNNSWDTSLLCMTSTYAVEPNKQIARDIIKSRGEDCHMTQSFLEIKKQTNLRACQGNDVSKWNACIGTDYSSSGNHYIGEFRNGLRNGLGALHSSHTNSIISQGIWSNGALTKSEKLQQSNFLNSNLPACQGTNPSIWDSCIGTDYASSGDYYVGEFRNGLKSGQGTLLSSYGSIINQGLWGNGVFISSSPIQQVQPLLPLQQVTAPTTEIEKLRAETQEAKRKQAEAEEQLRLSQQQTQKTTQTTTTPSIGRRVALVVGNANYKVRPLKNPRNDADDISRSLRSSGFEVIDLRDASLQQMRNGVRQFGDRLINNDVGLVYYSGHGVEVKGRNYFIPVNADIMREDEIADQGLDVSLILEKMNTAGKGVNILIVDACRDDPFGRSFRSSSRGLAQMDAPRGTIIAYATSPGKVASDGDPRERNSPYTKNLVKAMQQPNKPIEQVFKEVRRAVQEETKNQQTPWENTSLSGDFYFKVQR